MTFTEKNVFRVFDIFEYAFGEKRRGHRNS